MTMVRYPLPITNAMLLPANQHIMKPRYDASWASDWHGAQFGNEEDQAESTQAIANSCSARVETDYDPQHQKAKAGDMVPPLQILDDLGKDYGIYAGGAGRTGYVTPQTPYPAPVVGSWDGGSRAARRAPSFPPARDSFRRPACCRRPGALAG